MKLRTVLCAFLSAAMVAGLCGCQLFTAETDNLLAAPKLTGELQPIGAALSSGIKGEYTLRYPSGGDRRSAVILEDIDRDGVREAFAFYSRGEEEMHLVMIKRRGEKWVVSDDTSLVAGGVEKIEFYDFDGDGTDEITVGWEIHGAADKQLSVYNVRSDKFEQIFQQKYTAYIGCNLDMDGPDELFLQLLSSADQTNRAYVFRYEDGEFREYSSCAMDRGVKSIVSQRALPLSSGQTAVYVDELKNAGAVTEVLFLSKGQLVNPLLDSTSVENSRTERAASIELSDMDMDGLIEIPIAEEIPAVTGSVEKCYYTHWCSFNGESLTVKRTDLINQSDGFYMVIPEKWIGHIAVYRDTEKRLREFYALDDNGQPTARLAQLRTVKIKEWDKGSYPRSGLTELLRNKETVLAGSVNPQAGALAIGMDVFKRQLVILD